MRLKIIGIITIAGMIFVANAIISVQAGTPQELKMKEKNEKTSNVEEELNTIVKESINKAVTPKSTVGHDDRVNDLKPNKPNSASYQANTNDNKDDKPAPASIQPGKTTECGCRDYHFIGFTSKFYRGNLGGIAGAADKCRIEFGETARMCTTTEFNNRPPSTYSFYSTKFGWIQPDPLLLITTVVGEFQNKVTYILDKTGETVGDDDDLSKTGHVNLYNCKQWHSEYIKLKGMVVFCKRGSCWFNYKLCVDDTYIACCVP